MSTSPQPTLDRGSGELKSRILVVAAELFAERGYAATSMREVAEAAHCTKPALYYYFDNKGALFQEIIQAEVLRITRLIERQFARPGTVRERLAAAMHAYFDHVQRDPVGLKVLLRTEVHAENGQPSIDMHSARSLYIDLVIPLLREGVENGEIRQNVNLDDAMHALAGIVDLRCMLWVLEGDRIPPDYPERVLELMFEGVAP